VLCECTRAILVQDHLGRVSSNIRVQELDNHLLEGSTPTCHLQVHKRSKHSNGDATLDASDGLQSSSAHNNFEQRNEREKPWQSTDATMQHFSQAGAYEGLTEGPLSQATYWQLDRDKSGVRAEMGLTHRLQTRKLQFAEGINFEMTNGVKKDGASSRASADTPAQSSKHGTGHDEGSRVCRSLPASKSTANENLPSRPCEAGSAISDCDLWQELSEYQRDWPFVYAAYLHFRRKV
jgi:hypothetical protein